jgi:hypothetical protein
MDGASTFLESSICHVHSFRQPQMLQKQPSITPKTAAGTHNGGYNTPAACALIAGPSPACIGPGSREGGVGAEGRQVASLTRPRGQRAGHARRRSGMRRGVAVRTRKQRKVLREQFRRRTTEPQTRPLAGSDGSAE